MHSDNHSDISLKEFVIKTRQYLSYLATKWKLLLLSSLVFAILFGVLNINKPKRYTATLSFMLNVDERGLNSGLGSILGQFGFGIGASETNYDKIMKLSQARIITEKTVFDSISILDREDFLANHIITGLEEANEWDNSGFLNRFKKDTLSIGGFRFSNDSLSNFGLLENKALKTLHYKLVGSDKHKAMFVPDYDELTGIMTLSMTSYNEALSIEFVKGVFKNLSDYYIEKSTEKQQYEYDILREKYDSINYVLKNVQYRLAALEDSDKQIFRKKDILEKNRLKVEEQKLQYVSGKAEEQVQIAKIALDNKTPYIQLIDIPLSPIKPDNRPLVLNILLGLFAGFMLCLMVLVFVKLYNDILIEES